VIKKSLFPLALGGFGTGMTEFVMMGMLLSLVMTRKDAVPSPT
jgi:DHA1 family arabinose polymer transporter-like MFS transporter